MRMENMEKRLGPLFLCACKANICPCAAFRTSELGNNKNDSHFGQALHITVTVFYKPRMFHTSLLIKRLNLIFRVLINHLNTT